MAVNLKSSDDEFKQKLKKAKTMESKESAKQLQINAVNLIDDSDDFIEKVKIPRQKPAMILTSSSSKKITEANLKITGLKTNLW